ncbi:hypothetical protein [Streptomyces decoyicus]
MGATQVAAGDQILVSISAGNVHALRTEDRQQPQRPLRTALGAAGESLALISRTPAMHGGRGRSHWTVEQAGRPAVVGVKGHLFRWWVWWLLLPLWLAIAVGSIVGGGGIARMPRTIRWESSGEDVLVWSSDGNDFVLTVLADWWDPRVTASLAALVNSHDGWLGKPWDEGK